LRTAIALLLSVAWLATTGCADRGASADREKSERQLRLIGKACFLFASQHDGEYPETLDALVEDGGLEPAMLRPPQDPSARYQYLRPATDGSTTAPHNRDHVLAYEDPALNDGPGGYVLFVDGDVQWLKADELNRYVEATRASMNR
jgi:hypothetical protein